MSPTSRRSPEPYLWLLFSAGGMVTALLAPVLLLVFGVLVPLGWVAPPDRTHLLSVLGFPIVRAGLFVLCVLALFHSAHRCRHLLRDALRLRASADAVAFACYGTAILGSLVSAGLLLRL